MPQTQNPTPPTVQTHLSYHAPLPGCVDEYGEWNWPFSKFGYPNGGVLFTELHEEFNSVRCAIQDPYAWHIDVKEIAHLANDRQTFLTMLRERQTQRFEELQTTWQEVKLKLVARPDLWEKQIRPSRGWFNFIRVSRTFSYDSFLGFFGEWVADTPESMPALPNPPNLDSQSLDQQSSSQTTAETSNARGIEAGPDPQTLQVEEEVARPTTTAIRTDRIKRTTGTTRKGSTTAKTVGHGMVSPNKVVKRKPRGRNAEVANQEGLRRSARLREQAERGSR